ncbi:MAG: hypothetical protein R3324_00050 [Halobacteriales archaeon]|nr:hypothetical protein [Halobacteriales archaeon]
MNADRGVSEALGYVLVFGLVTFTIGTVYATGISGLYEAQQAEQNENMVRAFDVLADNLQDIHRRGATSRATEVKLAGGSIGFGESVRMTVYAEEVGVSSNNLTFVMNPQPIVYSHSSGTEVVYLGGAVIRTDVTGHAMRSDPEFKNDADRVILPLLITYQAGQGPRSIGGTSTVLVVARLFSSSLAGDPDTGFGDFDAGSSDVRVNVTIESPRAEAWGRYFERKGYTGIDDDASDEIITYQYTTDRVFVPRTEIEMSLRQ